MVEALYPGYLERYLENAQAYVACVLRNYGARWVARLGWEAAFAEALFGAMKGLVGWLLWDGPFNTSIPTIQTFILRGITYHFGKAVPWYVGPVRINVREYAKNPDAALHLINIAEEEELDTDELVEFSETEDGFQAVDDRDEHVSVLTLADQLDPSGRFREVVDLHHGITSGQAMTFEEIGRFYGIRKQAAHQRYQKAIRAIRLLMRNRR